MIHSLIGGAAAGLALRFLAEGHPMQHHLSDQQKVATADANSANVDYMPVFLDLHQLDT